MCQESKLNTSNLERKKNSTSVKDVGNKAIAFEVSEKIDYQKKLREYFCLETNKLMRHGREIF